MDYKYYSDYMELQGMRDYIGRDYRGYTRGTGLQGLDKRYWTTGTRVKELY